MTAIFSDAAHSLQDLETPSKSCSSNIKRSLIPLSQAKSTPFGSLSQEVASGFSTIGTDASNGPSTQLLCSPPIRPRQQPCTKAITPLESSNDQRMPALLSPGNHYAFSHSGSATDKKPEVTYPTLDGEDSPQMPQQALDHDSADEEIHSSHDIPLFLPLQPSKLARELSSVDSWLEEVIVSSPSNNSNTHIPDPPSLTESRQEAISCTQNTPRSVLKELSIPPRSRPLASYPSPTSTKNKPKPTSPTPPHSSPPNSENKKTPPSTSSSSSSNKENHPPKPLLPLPRSYPPTSPPHSTAFLSANLSRFGFSPSSPASPVSSLSPRTLLSLPARRQAAVQTPTKRVRGGSEIAAASQDWTIYEDVEDVLPEPSVHTPTRRHRAETMCESNIGASLSEGTIYGDDGVAAVGLSPEVEVFRKGKGRKMVKKDRCASYWDEDVLGGKEGRKEGESSAEEEKARLREG